MKVANNRIRIYEKFIEELEEYIKWNKNNKICANIISTIPRIYYNWQGGNS